MSQIYCSGCYELLFEKAVKVNDKLRWECYCEKCAQQNKKIIHGKVYQQVPAWHRQKTGLNIKKQHQSSNDSVGKQKQNFTEWFITVNSASLMNKFYSFVHRVLDSQPSLFNLVVSIRRRIQEQLQALIDSLITKQCNQLVIILKKLHKNTEKLKEQGYKIYRQFKGEIERCNQRFSKLQLLSQGCGIKDQIAEQYSNDHKLLQANEMASFTDIFQDRFRLFDKKNQALEKLIENAELKFESHRNSISMNKQLLQKRCSDIKKVVKDDETEDLKERIFKKFHIYQYDDSEVYVIYQKDGKTNYFKV